MHNSRVEAYNSIKAFYYRWGYCVFILCVPTITKLNYKILLRAKIQFPLYLYKYK